MEANPEACAAAVEKSLAMVTGLDPLLGYDRAAAVAKEAFATGKTIREAARKFLPENELRTLLDPRGSFAPK